MSLLKSFRQERVQPQALGSALAKAVWGSDQAGAWPRGTMLMLDIDRTVVDDGELAYEKNRGGLLHQVIASAEDAQRFAFLTARPCSDQSVRHTQSMLQGHGLGNTQGTNSAAPSCSVHSGIGGGRRVCSCSSDGAKSPVVFTGGACKGAAAAAFLRTHHQSDMPSKVIFADDQTGYLNDVKRGLRFPGLKHLHLIKMD